MSLDRNKPVQTRDGRKVTIYTWDAPVYAPIHGLVEGNNIPDYWGADGGYFLMPLGGNGADLINVPEQPKKHKFYAHMLKYDDGVFGLIGFPQKITYAHYLSAIKEIEIEEGEGL
jgi:hypothetical protein